MVEKIEYFKEKIKEFFEESIEIAKMCSGDKGYLTCEWKEMCKIIMNFLQIQINGGKRHDCPLATSDFSDLLQIRFWRPICGSDGA